jgi:hypothetical protein
VKYADAAMKRPSVLLALLLLMHGMLSAQSGPPEALLGGIDAVLFVCGPLDAKTLKDGTEMQARMVQQYKLDLTAVRKSPAYSSTYNAETNRLLALQPAKKIDACKNVF